MLLLLGAWTAPAQTVLWTNVAGGYWDATGNWTKAGANVLPGPADLAALGQAMNAGSVIQITDSVSVVMLTLDKANGNLVFNPTDSAKTFTITTNKNTQSLFGSVNNIQDYLTISNGTFSMSAPDLFWAQGGGQLGQVNVSGGTADFGAGSGSVWMGTGNNSTGAVNVTAGVLAYKGLSFKVGAGSGGLGLMNVSGGTVAITNSAGNGNELLILGNSSYSRGVLTQSGGVIFANSLVVGGGASSTTGAVGNAYLLGGTNFVTSTSGGFGIVFGYAPFSTGTVLVANSGMLLATNANSGSVSIGNITNSYGLLTVSGGVVLLKSVALGPNGSGFWNIYGGTNSAYTALTLGNAANAGTGGVLVAGGILTATNGAYIDVRRGSLSVAGGTVYADSLFATNLANSAFSFSSGTIVSKNSTVSNTAAFAVGDGTGAATYLANGGTHRFSDGISVSSNGTFRMTGTATNDALWTSIANGGAFSVSNGVATINRALTNSGAITVANGSVTWQSNVVLNSGSSYVSQSGTNTISAGVNFSVASGASVIADNTSQVTLSGNYLNLGSSVFSNLVTVASGGRLELTNGGSVVVVGGAVNNYGTIVNDANSGATLTLKTVSLYGGSVQLLGGTNIFTETAGSGIFNTFSGTSTILLANDAMLVGTNGGNFHIGNSSGTIGILTVSNGTLLTPLTYLGWSGGSGTINIYGGTNAMGQMTVGSAQVSTSTGNVVMAGGYLTTTNSTSSKMITVNHGSFLLSGGTVNTPLLLATNLAYSAFTFSGGTLVSQNTQVSNTLAFAVGNGTNAALYSGIGGTHRFSDGLSVSSNATVSLSGSTLDAPWTLVANGGVLAITNGTSTIVRQLTNSGAINVAGGAVIWQSNVVLNIGSTYLSQGGTNTISAGVNFSAAPGASVVADSASAVTLSGNYLNLGSSVFSNLVTVGSGGRYQAASLTNQFAGAMSIVGTLELTNGGSVVGGVVTNYGTVVNDAGSGGTLTLTKMVLNANSSTLFLGGTNVFTQAVNNNTFDNIGGGGTSTMVIANNAVVVNTNGGAFHIGNSSPGVLTVSNGTLLSQNLYLGYYGSLGMMNIYGGSNTVGTLELGNAGNSSSTGKVVMTGGYLTTTNGLATWLSVANGSFTLSGGTVDVGTLFASNGTHSAFMFSGGTLGAFGAVVSNTLPFVVGDGINAALYLTKGSGNIHRFADGLSVQSNSAFRMTGTSILDTPWSSVANGATLGLSNGNFTVKGVVTNQGVVQVVNSRVTYNAPVVISGGYVSDPSTNTFTSNVTVTAGGYLQGGSSDQFVFYGDLSNQSTNRTQFNLSQALVLFTNGNGVAATNHTLNLAGSGAVDMGSNFIDHTQLATNFSIGTLSIALSNRLALTGDVGSNALYVGVLDLSAWNTNAGASLTNTLEEALSLQGINLYYDKYDPNNAYLGGLEFDLWGSANSLLIPIPEPSPGLALLVGLVGFAVMRLRRQKANG